MYRIIFLIGFLIANFSALSQEIKVEFDKNRDFTKYKTYSYGECEIITPKDQRKISEATLHKWIKDAISRELDGRGLLKVDSTADLVVSYVVGTLARSDMENVGPMGLAPGSTEQTFIRDYQQGSLIIDLNDRNDFLVWRINSVTTMTPADGQKVIDQVVQKGFKQFLKPVKTKKSKKK
jgi:hypothetical protein